MRPDKELYSGVGTILLVFKSHREQPCNLFISNGKLYDIEMPFTYATVTYNYYAAAAPTSS